MSIWLTDPIEVEHLRLNKVVVGLWFVFWELVRRVKGGQNKSGVRPAFRNEIPK